MIHITIQCSRCSATGRLAIILKKKQSDGVGICWLINSGFHRTDCIQQYLKEVKKIMFQGIMMLLNFGKNVFHIRKEGFSKVQKRITSGKWVKQVHVAHVLKFMLIYAMILSEKRFPAETL